MLDAEEMKHEFLGKTIIDVAVHAEYDQITLKYSDGTETTISGGVCETLSIY